MRPIARCGCQSQCSCALRAGPGVTITGTGAPATPYVISAGGGGVLTVSDTPTVNLTLGGAGSDSDPYVLSAAAIVSPVAENLLGEEPDGLAVTCESVQDCVGNAMSDGLIYDDAANEFRARISGQANNSLSIGPDGGLYAPAGGGNPVATVDTACVSLDGDGAGTPLSATPVLDAAAGNLLSCGAGGLRAALATGACGLTGDGSAAAPLAARVQAWPYAACPPDGYAGGVYCDSAGVLRSEPRPYAVYDQALINEVLPAPVAVPAGFDNVIATTDVSIPNPDACRDAFVIMEIEVDIDFDLPANSGAAGGITTDEMQYFANRGSSAAVDVHCQVTKVFNRTIAAGGTLVEPVVVSAGRGSGGATFNRIQVFLRWFVFVL